MANRLGRKPSDRRWHLRPARRYQQFDRKRDHQQQSCRHQHLRPAKHHQQFDQKRDHRRQSHRDRGYHHKTENVAAQLPPPFRRQTRLRSLASLSPICVTGISTFRRSLPRRQSPANHHRSHERMSYGWRDFFPPSPCRSNFGYSPCNVSCGSGQRRKTRIATIYTGRIDLDRRRPGASSLMRKLKLSCV